MEGFLRGEFDKGVERKVFMAAAYPDDPNAQSIYDYLVRMGIPGGGQAAQQSIGRDTTAFQQTFQNLLGRAPTAQEISGFLGQEVAGQQHPDWADPYQMAQAYVPNVFGPDIQKKQQADLSGQQQQLQDTLNQSRQAGLDFYTKGPGMETIKGLLNNQGMADSGAFGSALASQLAGQESGLQSQALTGFTLPAFAGAQNLPYQSLFGMGANLQGGLAGRNAELQDFGLQSQLAQLLAEQSQPSGMQKALGEAGAATGAFKNLTSAASMGTTLPTSWVCRELIQRGLIKESDMDDFHVHIMPAMFKKARAFWKYAMDGKRLVDAVNAKGLSWSAFKPLLFDRVMQEPDACRAVDLYADACHQLCISSDYGLWDSRVYKASFWDSILFLPLLFLYKPFLKALWKSIRIRMLFVYDKPRCGHA